MTKTIWKYEIFPEAIIEMPIGAKILDVQEQFDKPYMWALVDKFAPKESRTFMCYGTGHNIPDDPGEYIGTFQMHGGGLVFHLFEVK